MMMLLVCFFIAPLLIGSLASALMSIRVISSRYLFLPYMAGIIGIIGESLWMEHNDEKQKRLYILATSVKDIPFPDKYKSVIVFTLGNAYYVEKQKEKIRILISSPRSVRNRKVTDKIEYYVALSPKNYPLL